LISDRQWSETSNFVAGVGSHLILKEIIKICFTVFLFHFPHACGCEEKSFEQQQQQQQQSL
jgi:hypothetical protein